MESLSGFRREWQRLLQERREQQQARPARASTSARYFHQQPSESASQGPAIIRAPGIREWSRFYESQPSVIAAQHKPEPKTRAEHAPKKKAKASRAQGSVSAITDETRPITSGRDVAGEAAKAPYKPNAFLKQFIDDLDDEETEPLFDGMPEEVAELVFLYLDLKTLVTCSQVSKQWKRISESNFVWHAYAVRNRMTTAPISASTTWCRFVKSYVLYKRQQTQRWKMLEATHKTFDGLSQGPAVVVGEYIILNRDGTVYAATKENTHTRRLHQMDGTKFRNVRSIHASPTGIVYLGTAEGNIHLLDSSTLEHLSSTHGEQIEHGTQSRAAFGQEQESGGEAMAVAGSPNVLSFSSSMALAAAEAEDEPSDEEVARRAARAQREALFSVLHVAPLCDNVHQYHEAGPRTDEAFVSATKQTITVWFPHPDTKEWTCAMEHDAFDTESEPLQSITGIQALSNYRVGITTLSTVSILHATSTPAVSTVYRAAQHMYAKPAMSEQCLAVAVSDAATTTESRLINTVLTIDLEDPVMHRSSFIPLQAADSGQFVGRITCLEYAQHTDKELFVGTTSGVYCIDLRCNQVVQQFPSALRVQSIVGDDWRILYVAQSRSKSVLTFQDRRLGLSSWQINYASTIDYVGDDHLVYSSTYQMSQILDFQAPYSELQHHKCPFSSRFNSIVGYDYAIDLRTPYDNVQPHIFG
eukprot:m.352713 g.352713  ORF g.352713 m.352713 type:complete len:699 (-) comp16599_c0_seq1:2274-4370(-)